MKLTFIVFMIKVFQDCVGADVVSSCSSLDVELPSEDGVTPVPRDKTIRWAKSDTLLSDTILLFDPADDTTTFNPSFVGNTSRYSVNSETFGLIIRDLVTSDADKYICFIVDATSYTHTVNLTINELPDSLTVTCQNGTINEEATISQLNPNCGEYPSLAVDKGSLELCEENAETETCSYVFESLGPYTVTATLGSLTEAVTCYGNDPPTTTESSEGCECEICNCTCNCEKWVFGVFIALGVVIPISCMISITITSLILIGTCACVIKCTTDKRLFEVKIHAVIHIIMIAAEMAGTIAVGVGYGRNKDQPENCDCCGCEDVQLEECACEGESVQLEDCGCDDGIYLPVVATLLVAVHIIVVIVFIVLIPKKIREECGSAEPRSNPNKPPKIEGSGNPNAKPTRH